MSKNIKSTIRIIILITTILFNMSSLASEYINKIMIQGNKRVERATIENYLTLKVGDKHSLLKENESVKSLYATSLFENINIKFLNNKNLVVNVTETPFVSKVIFKGNAKIKTSLLSSEMLTTYGESLSAAKIQLDVKKIQGMYKNVGHFSTIIIPQIEALENNRVKVIFDIKEGPKSGIKRIYFTGNNHYRNLKLKSLLLTRESQLLSSLFGSNDTYNPDRMEYDKELLKKFYHSVGFIDFRVISATAELSPTKEYFTITYSIEEGEKYNIGNISIDNKLSNINVAEIVKLINIQQGDIYNRTKLEKIMEKISTYATHQGYPQIVVYPDLTQNPDDRTIDLKFIIDKTSKVFINRININNNFKTKDKVIRRELKVVEGDLYSRFYKEKSERNLRNLEYFTTAGITLIPTDKQDKYDININVEEQSTCGFNGGIGFSSAVGGTLQATFAERNLLGTGRLFSIDGDLNSQNSTIGANITDPYFLDLNLLGSVSVAYTSGDPEMLFAKKSEAQKKAASESRSIQLTGSLGYDVTENLSHQISYSWKHELVSKGPDINEKFLTGQTGKFITSAIGNQLTYDLRDSKITPKNGSIITVSQKLAGFCGDVKYWKHTIIGKYFRSFINNEFTVGLFGYAGRMDSINDHTIRISDRFSLSSLKGFSTGGVGPREKKTDGTGGVRLGGENYYQLSAELYFPTLKLGDVGIQNVAFVDMGSLWGIRLNSKSTYTEADFYHDESIRVSVGVGVILKFGFLPPIRINYSLPIRHTKYDKIDHWHVQAGMMSF